MKLILKFCLSHCCGGYKEAQPPVLSFEIQQHLYNLAYGNCKANWQ